MSLSPKAVRVGGRLLSSLLPAAGYWGDLSWTHRRAGGFYSAKFSLLVPPGWRHPAIVRGARVELWDGGYRFGIGTLAEPDWNGGSFEVAGLCQAAMGQNAPLALDGTLGPAGPYTTTIPNVAVDQAITRGALPGWSRTEDLGSVELVEGDVTDGVNTVGQILDAASARDGRPWQVDRNGAVAFVADSTTPDYHVYPGVVELGSADDEYVTHVFVNYLDSFSSTYRRAVAADDASARKWGRVEHSVDLTGQGSITYPVAQSVAASILAGGKRRPGWVNAIEVSADQLRLNGGMSADLSSVCGGEMVRVHGVLDEMSGASHVDVVISEVQRTDQAPTVTLLPQGLASRTLSSVIEDAVAAVTFTPLAS